MAEDTFLLVRAHSASGYQPGNANYLQIDAGSNKFKTKEHSSPAWNEEFEIGLTEATEVKFVLHKDQETVGSLTFKVDYIVKQIQKGAGFDNAKRYKLLNSNVLVELQFRLKAVQKGRSSLAKPRSSKGALDSEQTRAVSPSKRTIESTSDSTREKSRRASFKEGSNGKSESSEFLIQELTHAKNKEDRRKEKDIIVELKEQLSWVTEDKNDRRLELEQLQQKLQEQIDKNKQLDEKLRSANSELRNSDRKKSHHDSDKIRQVRSVPSSDAGLRLSDGSDTSKDAQIKALKLKLERLERQLKEGSNKVAGVEVVDDLRRRLTESHNTIAQQMKLIKEAEDLKIMYAEAKTKLHSYKQNIEQLTQQAGGKPGNSGKTGSNAPDEDGDAEEGAGGAFAVYKLEIEALRTRCKDIEAMLKEATTKYFTLFDLYEDLKTSSTPSPSAASGKGTGEIENLKADLNTARAETRKWKESYEDTKAKADSAEKARIAAEEKLRQVEKEKAALEKEKTGADEKLKQLQKEAGTASEKEKQKAKETEEKFRKQEKDLEASEEKFRKLGKDLEASEEKFRKVEKEKAALEKEKQTLFDKLRESEEKLRVGEKDKLSVSEKVRIDKQEKALKELQEEKSKLAAMLKAADERLRTTESELAQSKTLGDRVKELEKDLAAKTAELAKVKEESSKARKSSFTETSTRANDSIRTSDTVTRAATAGVLRSVLSTSLPSLPPNGGSETNGTEIPPNLPPEKELEILRERLKKSELEIKKAVMQGRIQQKKAEEKSREEMKKAQKESEGQYEQLLTAVNQELDAEREKVKNALEGLEKGQGDKKMYEERYVVAEKLLKDQDKVLKDILEKLKAAESSGNKNILREILSTKPPPFTTYVDMLRPNEMLIKYGVPVHKIRT